MEVRFQLLKKIKKMEFKERKNDTEERVFRKTDKISRYRFC